MVKHHNIHDLMDLVEVCDELLKTWLSRHPHGYNPSNEEISPKIMTVMLNAKSVLSFHRASKWNLIDFCLPTDHEQTLERQTRGPADILLTGEDLQEPHPGPRPDTDEHGGD